MTTADPGNRAL